MATPPRKNALELPVITPALALQVLTVFAAVLMLQYAAAVLLPIVLSLLLFYALDPVVDRLERRRVPRGLASVGAVLALVAALAIGGRLLWPQFEAVVTSVPRGVAQFRAAIADSRRDLDASPLGKVREAAKAIDTVTAEASEPPVTAPGVMRVEVQQPWRVSDWLWYGSLNAISLSGQALTVVFLTIFLLYEDDSFKRKLVRQMKTGRSKRLTVHVLNDIARQLERFLWVQALTCSAVAVATGLALWGLGLEQPAIWGLFAGVMNIIPYFGPLIVTVVVAAVAFIQFGSFEQAALVSGVALAITTIEGMWLTPHLLSRAASLNHVAIFVALAFWSWAWGVPGMLLAVPMLMALKAICDHVEALRTLAAFLGD